MSAKVPAKKAPTTKASVKAVSQKSVTAAAPEVTVDSGAAATV
jgi:hypothetical protein